MLKRGILGGTLGRDSREGLSCLIKHTDKTCSYFNDDKDVESWEGLSCLIRHTDKTCSYFNDDKDVESFEDFSHAWYCFASSFKSYLVW